MADRTLVNFAEIAGRYGAVPFAEESSTKVTVTLAEIPFEKSADKEVWLNGELTFFLEIDNSKGSETLSNVVIQDKLDITMFAYIADSVVVEIDGAVIPTSEYAVTYTPATGILTVTLNMTAGIPAGGVANISFRGTKVSPTP